MGSIKCETIALAHKLVSFSLNFVFNLVENDLANKGECNGGAYLTIDHEDLNPEPLFKRSLLTRQVVSDLTRQE